jgi:hypothetical protein
VTALTVSAVFIPNNLNLKLNVTYLSQFEREEGIALSRNVSLGKFKEMKLTRYLDRYTYHRNPV